MKPCCLQLGDLVRGVRLLIQPGVPLIKAMLLPNQRKKVSD
jgi:hypothetical protein